MFTPSRMFELPNEAARSVSSPPPVDRSKVSHPMPTELIMSTGSSDRTSDQALRRAGHACSLINFATSPLLVGLG